MMPPVDVMFIRHCLRSRYVDEPHESAVYCLRHTTPHIFTLFYRLRVVTSCLPLMLMMDEFITFTAPWRRFIYELYDDADLFVLRYESIMPCGG